MHFLRPLESGGAPSPTGLPAGRIRSRARPPSGAVRSSWDRALRLAPPAPALPASARTARPLSARGWAVPRAPWPGAGGRSGRARSPVIDQKQFTEPLNGLHGWELIIRWINNALRFTLSRQAVGPEPGGSRGASLVTPAAVGTGRGMVGGWARGKKRGADEAAVSPAIPSKWQQEDAELKDQASQEVSPTSLRPIWAVCWCWRRWVRILSWLHAAVTWGGRSGGILVTDGPNREAPGVCGGQT